MPAQTGMYWLCVLSTVAYPVLGSLYLVFCTVVLGTAMTRRKRKAQGQGEGCRRYLNSSEGVHMQCQ